MKKSIISIFAISLILGSCTPKSNVKGSADAVKVPVVKLATSYKSPVMQQAEFTGTIEPYAVNNISPSLSLRIDKIHVEVGDKVRRGQLLVEMDKRQYLQAAVQLANLETDFVRYEKLYQEGGISKQQLDQLETQLSVSRHAVGNLKENANLISPISGVVTDRAYDPGDVYSMGANRILTVMQIDKVKVQVHVSEQYFPFVKLGMPVDIALEVYPGKTFTGKVSLIYPSLDPATRTFTTEITIPNSSSEIRPGMFSKVKLNFGVVDHVLVPDVAVQKQIGTNERYVFVYNDNGTVDRRSVALGRVVGKEMEIISGVEDGDRVVVAGAQKLMDKAKVQVQTKK
ncbi:MAG: efflux RND transporter periplasmic adaptor subunit [Rikenellaceae bacterium]